MEAHLPAPIRCLVLAGFALLLAGGLACKSPETEVKPPRREAGVDMRPDGEPACLVGFDQPARPPGQPCVCAGDCLSANCENGVCCSGNECGNRRPLGAPCAAGGQCQSRFCVDGLCCNNACQGACVACNLPNSIGECSSVDFEKPDPRGICRKEAASTCGENGLCDGDGKCQKHIEETVCTPAICDSAGRFQPQGGCDGKGVCLAAKPVVCDPSRCENGACVERCTSDAQCIAGKACVDGTCGEYGPGRTCKLGSECLSNFCVDGVCCEDACVEKCHACNTTAARGKCVAVAAGTPDPMCAVTAASSCGTTGRCDAESDCALWDETTVCRAAVCNASGNSATDAVRCDFGVCPAATAAESCEPYRGCNGTTCRVFCESDAHCSDGYGCSGGACVIDQPAPVDAL